MKIPTYFPGVFEESMFDIDFEIQGNPVDLSQKDISYDYSSDTGMLHVYIENVHLENFINENNENNENNNGSNNEKNESKNNDDNDSIQNNSSGKNIHSNDNNEFNEDGNNNKMMEFKTSLKSVKQKFSRIFFGVKN